MAGLLLALVRTPLNRIARSLVTGALAVAVPAAVKGQNV
jgi:hypothetical protein